MTVVGTPAPAHVGPHAEAGGGQGPRGTLTNVIVGHLHDLSWQGAETLLHVEKEGKQAFP
jgi:hypothetical protein